MAVAVSAVCHDMQLRQCHSSWLSFMLLGFLQGSFGSRDPENCYAYSWLHVWRNGDSGKRQSGLGKNTYAVLTVVAAVSPPAGLGDFCVFGGNSESHSFTYLVLDNGSSFVLWLGMGFQ